ncbi:hypothetical protein [Actinokineospora xionganensis]|uniref:Uncharacterized protein n=1 Tax=Actinokineospora xionganensis TaxID=2684470 RepID=A0ABR7LFE5_9PSEU|nr:hypothetical protein [Actinokineospora xionganensis]MBC6451453.1 hypothetical protein [Actinokineospora xionganensis]
MAVHLGAQLMVLRQHEGLDGTGGNIPAVANLQNVYAGYTDMLASRLADAVDIIAETGGALEEIVTLYRRVDGQS